MSIEGLNGIMAYRSELENLDEDGYTQLQFSSRDITKKPVSAEKGIFFLSFCLPHFHTHQLKNLTKLRKFERLMNVRVLLVYTYIYYFSENVYFLEQF